LVLFGSVQTKSSLLMPTWIAGLGSRIDEFSSMDWSEIGGPCLPVLQSGDGPLRFMGAHQKRFH